MVRAKFVVVQKGLSRDQVGSVLVVLKPVYSGSTSNPEDAKFQNATSPDGECRMLLLNPKAAEYFEIGKAYYLDFTLASAPVQ